MDLKDFIIRPIITEKATGQTAEGKYSFQVDRVASKREVKKAVEKFFGVKVRRVNIITVRGKRRRMIRTRRQTKAADWKKAVVQLAEGEKIDIFELPAGKQEKEKK